MSDPFVAEVRMFTSNFAPKGWAFCNGQILPISQNTALFSLLGTTYGGDGKSTFALPDLQARSPMFWGQGPGLSLRDIGEEGGSETVTLLESQIPPHAHTLVGNNDVSESRDPEGRYIGQATSRHYLVAAPNATGAPLAINPTGGNGAHNNRQPYLVVNFIIALQGIYPPRS